MDMQEKKGGNIAAIATMFALFFMIAFVTNFAGSMSTVVKNQFGASDTASQLGSAANFFAYLFMGIPGGLILKRKGYKFTAVLATVVGFIGVGVQLLSGYVESFNVYLTGAFIAGFSMCLLNLVVNPLLNTLGGEGKKGNQLVQVGCSLNSVGATLSPIILGYLIGGEVAKANVGQAAPALLIAMALFAIATIVVAFSKIPEPHLESAEEKATRLAGKTSILKDIVETLKFKHFTFGAIAIFFYITIEVGIFNFAVKYMTETKEIESKAETMLVEEAEALIKAEEQADKLAVAAATAKGEKYVKVVAKPGEEFSVVKIETQKDGQKIGKRHYYTAGSGFTGAAVAGVIAGSYWLCMMIGRLVGGAIGGKISSKVMITVCSCVGIALMLATIYVPVKMISILGYTFPLSMCFMSLCGLCTSVMWGGIFNLATEGLGKYVPMGSGIFMSCVSGGVLLTFQGWIASKVGNLNSYWMTIALLAYVLLYALVLSKPTKRAE